MNNLLIVGNGFDLAHNLKTSYNDFMNYVIDSHLANKLNFKTLVDTSNYNINTKEQAKEYARNTPINRMEVFPNKFFGILLSEYSLQNWCDIENKYYSVLMEERNRYCDVKKFHDDFEEVKKYFTEYLNSINFDSITINSYQKLFHKIINDSSLLLNFNYTPTLENYSKQKQIISPSNIINIHGELNNSANPIIFGFAANDQESRELINLNDKEYMRYIKKHCYKRTDNEEKLKRYLNRSEINVFILGHSCGISDKLILNEIFNHENINSIRVFYHEEHEKYFETQVNIDRIMDNDFNFKKLKSFQSSFRMPQINDTVEQENEFLEYIDSFIENNNKVNFSDPRVI